MLLLLVFYIEGFLCVFTYPRNLINVKIKSGGGIRLAEVKHSILAVRHAKGYQLQRLVRVDRQNFKQRLLPWDQFVCCKVTVYQTYPYAIFRRPWIELLFENPWEASSLVKKKKTDCNFLCNRFPTRHTTLARSKMKHSF